MLVSTHVYTLHVNTAMVVVLIRMAITAHLERGGHVGEVGNAPSDDEDLALRVFLFGHQAQDRLGILKRLTWGGGG